MTDQEILEKATQQAIDGGCPNLADILPLQVFDKNKMGTYVLRTYSGEWVNIEGIIFNHDFAKALWGKSDERIHMILRHGKNHEDLRPLIALWQYHLQQMVIADDPIQYLGESI